jgi:hypothetical protein
VNCNNVRAGVFTQLLLTRQSEETMNVHSKIPSDIIGLITPAPLSDAISS